MKNFAKFTLWAGLLLTASVQAKDSVTIGTGGQTGVYYVAGQSICQLVNRYDDFVCKAPSTGASLANLDAIADQSLDMGIVQSDWQYHAYHGSDVFAGKANPKLRAVFSLHAEPFTVMARDDAKITVFDDIKGKRINIGDAGSGTRATMNVIMQAKGWTNDDFRMVTELQPSELADVICRNYLDVITYSAGNPNGTFKEAANECETHLVPVTGAEVDKLVAEYPYYAKAVIPANTYKGTDNPVETFGVYATLVTSEEVPADKVYAVVKAVFDNFDRFKRTHPAFAHLSKEEMIRNALSVPLHEGAARYYREQGWLK
ncbi:TAXI family TRAP transporter solute-binding subunit [Bisgaard Taxon 10/6]|uniref:TAXI family TRAP transporter solute-binding subunit n=1 Tax=Exercitatus varius TaxID=67857 RepID=UPI00294AC0A8|nr:TAXI family TRAP transporter solute-binding subunit [Exercitatus varius]MDG2954363.1 TAXI family TRAP transporter solute-binding subunit [Exercitatus varius]